jgi:hypothetical protein
VNTVAASSNETPCFFRFEAAFRSSQEKCTTLVYYFCKGSATLKDESGAKSVSALQSGALDECYFSVQK